MRIEVNALIDFKEKRFIVGLIYRDTISGLIRSGLGSFERRNGRHFADVLAPGEKVTINWRKPRLCAIQVC
jgi:hypothetical protein